MTVLDVMLACRRLWYVVLLGVILTAGTATVVHREPGVYWAQSDMVFLAPISTRYPNSLSTGSGSLISTAGLVERLMNADSSQQPTVSSAITLVDRGITDGASVELPNYGGQWAYNFAKPVLDLEVAGDTPATVRLAMTALQQRVRDTLVALQDRAGVDQYNRISTQSSPAVIDVDFRKGQPKRALLATVLLGGCLTLGIVISIHKRRCRRQADRYFGDRRNTKNRRFSGQPQLSRH